MTNLAADPNHARTVKQLDAQLMSELKASEDPRAYGGREEFDRYIWSQRQRMDRK